MASRRLLVDAAALAAHLAVARAHDGRSAWVGPSARVLAAQVLAGLDEGTLAATGRDLARLLDECFVSLYTATPEGRARAATARDRYLAAVATDPGVREHFLLHEPRLRGNFAYADGA